MPRQGGDAAGARSASKGERREASGRAAHPNNDGGGPDVMGRRDSTQPEKDWRAVPQCPPYGILD